MKLLTTKEARSLPPLRSTEGQGGTAPVRVKWFDPLGDWRWYATEASALDADGNVLEGRVHEHLHEAADIEFFGLVAGHEKEYGYWRLSDLRSIATRSAKHRRFGLGIERDLHFITRAVGDFRDGRAT